jgi:hypothetical protein
MKEPTNSGGAEPFGDLIQTPDDVLVELDTKQAQLLEAMWSVARGIDRGWNYGSGQAISEL